MVCYLLELQLVFPQFLLQYANTVPFFFYKMLKTKTVKHSGV